MYKKGFSRYLLILSMIASLGAAAQNLTQSPYSFLGIGEVQFNGTVQLTGIGQTAQAYRRPYEVNLLNPASYSAFQQTIFEAGYLFANGSLMTSSASSKISNASFAYFNFGMPVSQKLGIGLVFGLSPYSSVGYNLSASATYSGSPSYTGTTKMQGRGGLSRFYAGTSYRIHKNISAGINVNYLFGRIETSQQLIFDTVYHMTNIAEDRNMLMGDFTFDLGLQFHKSLNDKYKITAGLTYTPSAPISSTYSYYNKSLGWNSAHIDDPDTNVSISGQQGNIQFPQAIKAGLCYEKKGVWMVLADVNYFSWSQFSSFASTDKLSDNLVVSLGASIIPDASAPKNYLRRVEYRAGARFDNGCVEMNGTRIKTMSVSAGLGFPMGNKSQSKLNFGVEYLTTGTTDLNLIRQDMIRLSIGITFCDKWFNRYKYD